jgi:GTPase SAR1 family protein
LYFRLLQDSFEGAKHQILEIKRNDIVSDAMLVLVGNKCDLDHYRMVPKNEA